MNKQVLTRRGLFVLGLTAIGGRAFAADDTHNDSAAPSRHRGYKVGGGMVILVIAAVATSMVMFGDLRRYRSPKAPKPPLPLPDESEWDSFHSNEAEAGGDSEHAPRPGPWRRRPREDATDTPKD